MVTGVSGMWGMADRNVGWYASRDDAVMGAIEGEIYNMSKLPSYATGLNLTAS